LLLAVLGVFLLCSANDLITAYLSIELQSLAFYILASFKKESSFSIHAGLKYFILGAFASCLFLFSSSLIYGLTGTINLEEIFSLLSMGSFFGVLGCFDFFLKDLLTFSKFSFYYAFDSDFEDMVLELYFCIFESSFTNELDTFIKLENNFENILIISNKFFYYGSDFQFNFMAVLKWLFNYCLFFFEWYYIPFTFDQFLMLFSDEAGMFKSVRMETCIMFESFFNSIICYNFLFLNDFNNVFVLKTLEFYSIIVHMFSNISFITAFCGDIFITEFLCDSSYLFDHFVLDMFYFYFKSYNLLNTIILLCLLYTLIFSLFFKLAVVPFNLWLPDVYEGSLSSTTAFFAIIPKLSIFIFLFRLLDYGILDDTLTFQYYLLLSGVVSILYGSIIAIEERKLKSLMAFSAISNIGFILIAFSSFTMSSNAMVFCYFVIYMLATLLIWFVILTYNSRKSIEYKKFNKELSSFSNFYKSNKVMAFLFSMALFSIAGIPPFIGFIAKFGVFLTAIEASNYITSVVSILGSVIAIFYYLRIIKIIFFEDNDNNISLYSSINSFFFFIFMGLFLLLILLFINPSILYLSMLKISYTFF